MVWNGTVECGGRAEALKRGGYLLDSTLNELASPEQQENKEP